MTRAALASAATLLWVALSSVPAHAALPCKPTLRCESADLVTAARAIVERDCPCAQAASKKAYKKCAKRALKTAKTEIGPTFSKRCRKDVKGAIANSTCGRPGFVACNKRNRKDTKTKCKVTRTDKCKGSACGAFTSCLDACNPNAQACATTTTTSTTTSTTTTLPPICGDGQVTGGEQCDPPCSDGGCGAGEICNSSCQCETPAPCACGASEPSFLTFTSGVGSGNCGTALNSNGDLVDNLACGGLYFGGGANAVPLPATVPDMSMSYTRTCCSGTTVYLGPASAADTGSQRTCTSPGCLFGAPLPIPNYANRAISTCVLNVISGNAVGQGECTTGESDVSLPLTSQVFLYGDLLNGSIPERPDVRGLQPCPICSTACAGGDNDGLPCTGDPDCPNGGTCGASAECIGGANHGMACTPETSVFGGRCDGGTARGQACVVDMDCPGVGAICSYPYPTSHDCPPPPGSGQPVGQLPIAFALSTGTTTRTAVDFDPGETTGSSDRVFCGFCRDYDDTFNFGLCQPDSVNAGTPCAAQGDCDVCVGGSQDAQGCGNEGARDACVAGGGTCQDGTCGGLVPCTSDADCSQPLERCQQRDNGAFFGFTQTRLGPTVRTITMTGSPSGDLTDGQPHAAKLAGIFCIPPVLDPSIDAAADLPGPGAVALEGMAQLLP